MSASFTVSLTLKGIDQMSAVVDSALGKTIGRITQVQDRMKRVADQSAGFGRSAVAGGLAAGAAMLAPLKAFSDLETASTDLKIAMMDSLGNIPPQFEAINRQAIELGNRLPGTTADFLGVARALQEQGTAMDTVLNGGLKSASYLSVLLKLPGAEAATMVAKLREAYGLADNELEKMADLVQRARYAFGMAPQDLMAGAAYAGTTQNILGLKGLQNAKQLLALQGLGAGVSLEGSSWGTNFAMMLNRLAESQDRLAKNSKEMKALNADLKAAGISLEFFGDNGKFVGLESMVRQLEQLNKLKDVDKLNALKKIFGVEAARPAAIIAGAGVAGLNEGIAKMERQASLQQKIDELSKTLSFQAGSLAGTITNALTLIGGPMADVLKPLIQQANDFVGGPLMRWLDENQKLAGTLGVTVLGLAALSIGLGAAALAFSGLVRGASMILTVVRWMLLLGRGAVAVVPLLLRFGLAAGGALVGGLRLLGSFLASAAGSLLWVGRMLAGSFALGLRMAAQAVFFLGRALLMNPIGLLVAGIAVAAYLVYKNWATVKAALLAGYTWIRGQASQWYAAGLALVQRLAQALQSGAARVSAVWASIRAAFQSAIGYIRGLAGAFFSAGASLIDGLVRGVQSKIAAARAAIAEAAAAVKNSFTGLLGIHSPSTVFMAYGEHLAAGAALGMQRGIPQIQKASRVMATATVSTYGPVAVPNRAGSFGPGGGLVVTFAPTIHVQGGGADAGGQVKAALDDSYREFEAMMRRYKREQDRRMLG